MLDFAKEKSFWDNVRTSPEFQWHISEIKEIYDKAFKTEPRAHSAADILGNDDKGLWRLQFDHLQSSCLLALIYPDTEEYYNNLIKSIWAYLDDYTWAPLGHYTEHYYGVTPKDFDFGLIDIFAASASFALAEIKNLFQDRFPKLLTDRITYEIRRRTIEPFLSRKYFWETHDNNWTAVCTGAVGGVLIYEAPEIYRQCKERLHKAMEHYLASYKEDGMCVEGVGYWAFGFGFFSSYALLEREITNGEVDWFSRPKVKEIAKFLQKTFLQRDIVVTYGDCSVTQNYQTGLPALLRAVYGDEIERLPKSLGVVGKNNTHFNFLLRAVLYHNEDNFSDSVSDDVTYTAPGSCYIIKRTKGFGFSAKGGNNGESHNHIDVGNFIIARNNKQIICDAGAGPYEDGYHTDRRYTFFHPSALSHNIPVLDGISEDGIRRDDVIVHYDAEKSCAYMDIKEGYPADFINKAERKFYFEDEKITLVDSFDFTKKVQVTEHFVSLIEPKAVGNDLYIEDVKLSSKCGTKPIVTVREVKAHVGERLHPVYLIDYVLERGITDFELAFEVVK